MSDLWYPRADRAYADRGTSAFTGGPSKGVLHSTEGKTLAGALAAYRSHGGWPHFTWSWETGKEFITQHYPVNQYARALRNESGGVQTNTDGAVQIEIVGTCDERNDWGRNLSTWRLPDEALRSLADLMRWIEKVRGVKRIAVPTWKAYPSSYGDNGIRMSGREWDGFNGWCGHQHVPENSHGDPGRLDIDRLLEGAAGGIMYTCKKGQSGDAVGLLQHSLNELGAGLDVDEDYGDKTAAAVTRIMGWADGDFVNPRRCRRIENKVIDNRVILRLDQHRRRDAHGDGEHSHTATVTSTVKLAG